jgi:phage/plasmid-like protein (TIGR03299 family)
MVHNLEINENGEASFFTVKQKAWHNLGLILENCPTSAEAIKLAKMDFTVEKHPVIVTVADEQFTSTEQFYTKRMDKTGIDAVLGYVGNGYNVLQNIEAFDFFDKIVGEGQAIYETAGVLGKGERIFMTAKLPKNVIVGNNDVIETYIMLTNSHDGSNAVIAAITPVRVVCQNTLNAALKDNFSKLSIKHTINMQGKLKAAQTIMQYSNDYTQALSSIFPAMAQKQIKEADFKRIIGAAFTNGQKELKEFLNGEGTTQQKNTYNAVMEYHHSNETQKMVTTSGTVFGAYNAVTGYFQNVAKFKDDGLKTASILDGDVNKKQQKSFEEAMTLTFGKEFKEADYMLN